MKLSELLEGLEIIDQSAPMGLEIKDLSYDSRKTKPGDLFVAVRGFETDGHAYIDAAVANGASAVLCETAPGENVPYIRVADSRRALALLSVNYFGNPASQMRMIGVTGTNGKTTVTMLIKHLLETRPDTKVGLIGTNQNMIGDMVLETERTTPDSYELQSLLCRMAGEGCTHVVMEVSSHSLFLDRVAGLRFEVGIFTNLTQDHLDFHETMDKYAEAKALLFGRCDTAVINLDDDWSDFMRRAAVKAGCRVLTCSAQSDEADVTARDIRLYPDKVKFCALRTGVLERVTLGIPGRFSVANALAVITCGAALDFSVAECAAALETAKGVKGRMEVVPAGEGYTVLIDYAHSPDALEKVLKSLREVARGRVVVLFGCGGDRDKTKRPLMGRIAAQYADFVIVTSDNPRTEEPSAIITDIIAGLKGSKTPKQVIENRVEAIGWALAHSQSDDVLLLAGKGHETYQIVGKTKHHMDEREIVADYLKAAAAGFEG